MLLFATAKYNRRRRKERSLAEEEEEEEKYGENLSRRSCSRGKNGGNVLCVQANNISVSKHRLMRLFSCLSSSVST